MKLTESEILNLIREEWNKKVFTVLETVGVKFDVGKQKQPILSPELKLLRKKTGIRYTIQSVGTNDVVLKNPEGKQFSVDRKELEQEYELD